MKTKPLPVGLMGRVGRCPACDDFMCGEWTDGSELRCDCGALVTAVATHDKHGATRWYFRLERAAESRRGKARR